MTPAEQSPATVAPVEWRCRNDDGTVPTHKPSMFSIDLCDECRHAEEEDHDDQG